MGKLPTQLQGVVRFGKQRIESIFTASKAHGLFSGFKSRPAALLCIYRHRNKPTVRALVEQGQQRGMKIALWALDQPIPELTFCTVGSGPGARMDLLNSLWELVVQDDVHQLVIADDDITFTKGSLGQLLSATIACEFGIAQPAHDWTSQCSYIITRKWPLLLARQTTFVEPGPLFVVNQPWIQQVMPFPENFGMGWGIWVLWMKLQKQGCTLGIIDCVTVHHRLPGRRQYSSKEEKQRLRVLLHEQNFQKPTEAQKILGSWKVWQNEPPWRTKPK